MQNTFADLSQKVYQLRLYSQSQASTQHLNLNSLYKVRYAIFVAEKNFNMIKIYMHLQIRESKSCPDIKVHKKLEDTATQTSDLLPYEDLLLGILEQKTQMNLQKRSVQDTEFRLSPTAMLDRYVETCTHGSNYSGEKMS